MAGFLFALIDRAAVDPTELWVWGLLSILIATGVGFFAGYQWAVFREQTVLKRAKNACDALMRIAQSRLRATREACDLLAQVTQGGLSDGDLRDLELQQEKLGEALGRITRKATVEGTPPETWPNDSLSWVAAPENAITGLPDRAVLNDNLTLLFDTGRRTQRTSGLLLVKLDKYSELAHRHGTPAAQYLLKRLGLVLCSTVRDEDFVCHLHQDQFALLFPNVDAVAAEQLAQRVRQTVRNYRFRIEGNGDKEVFLTASFGLTICLISDHPDLAINRAVDAISRSERLGRNQLHKHDGQALAHCVTN